MRKLNDASVVRRPMAGLLSGWKALERGDWGFGVAEWSEWLVWKNETDGRVRNDLKKSIFVYDRSWDYQRRKYWIVKIKELNALTITIKLRDDWGHFDSTSYNQLYERTRPSYHQQSTQHVRIPPLHPNFRVLNIRPSRTVILDSNKMEQDG